MNTTSTHIADIQTFAAQLSHEQDKERLYYLLNKIHTFAWKAQLEIHDVASQGARVIFEKHFDKTPVIPLLKLSTFLDGKASELCKRLRVLIQAGEIPGVKKNGRWYANVDTLAGWIRLRGKLGM